MTTEIDVNNDDDVISYTQNQRKRIADRLTDEGIPVANEDLSILLQTLDGLSKTAIQRKRIGVDEAANETTKVAAHAISNVLATFGERNPFAGKAGNLNGPIIDVNALPHVELVPGETAQGIMQDNHENFTAEYTAANPKRS